MTEAEKKRNGISGSTLKIIAIVTMLFDHIGAAILERLMIQGGFSPSMNIQEMADFIRGHMFLYYGDMVIRLLGRVSFPIFCFLLIEGFWHTHNLRKYGMRLFLFALLSEIPFDLAFSGKLLYWEHQNVFFTLAIGLIVITGYEIVNQKQNLNHIMKALFQVLIFIAGAGIAYLMRCDYDAFGVITIVFMYELRRNRVWQALAGCISLTVMSLVEITSFLSVIPILKYNGKRGISLKYVFYAFYPIHLFLLYLIARILGVAEISVF